MNSSDYWKTRIAKEEAKSHRIAAEYSHKQELFYKRSVKKIETEIDALYAEIADKGIENITRTQLWQFGHYTKLKELIYNESSELGSQQLNLLEQCLGAEFEQKLDINIETAKKGALSYAEHSSKDAMIHTVWSGKSYSERIWQNTNKLATSVQDKVTDLLVLGKTPQQVKREIREEFDVSYRVADRLIRTEASHIFNEASIERYANAGVQQVEILVEVDCCDECSELATGSYNVNEAPILPIHPNCRCCYIPVIDEEARAIEKNALTSIAQDDKIEPMKVNIQLFARNSESYKTIQLPKKRIC